jgi:hypothetical protein
MLGQVMVTCGFVEFADKSVAWDGETRPSKDLIRLIKKSCKGTEDLVVQSAELQAVIKEKLVSIFPQLFHLCPMIHAPC